MHQPSMKPLIRTGGYLPIEDHGLIGDGATAALIGRDGGIAWLCAPRFDSPPLFCSILDQWNKALAHESSGNASLSDNGTDFLMPARCGVGRSADVVGRQFRAWN